MPGLAAIRLFKYIDFSAITRAIDSRAKVGGMFPYFSDLQLRIKTQSGRIRIDRVVFCRGELHKAEKDKKQDYVFYKNEFMMNEQCAYRYDILRYRNA